LVAETGQTPDALSAFLSGGVGPDWQFSEQYLGGSGQEIGLWAIPLLEDGAGVDALRDAAAGGRNDDYTDWAETIADSGTRADGEPIYIRPDWEIGGEWFEWTARAQADVEAYKDAFGQMADSFRSVDSDFQMVWDPTSDRGDQTYLYPGDEAVDVIGQSHYFIREFQGDDPVAAFEKVENGYSFGLSQIDAFAEERGKAIGITELGVSGADAGVFFDEVQAWAAGQDNLAFVNVWYVGPESGYDGRSNPAAVGEFLAEGVGGGSPNAVQEDILIA
jgi:Glycosyl hydrolase family 26